MPRPKRRRRIAFYPRITYFKPQGVPMRFLEQVELTAEEAEALRLKYVEGHEQMEAAARMNTSQSTFQRILQSANGKIGSALIQGKAIRLTQK